MSRSSGRTWKKKIGFLFILALWSALFDRVIYYTEFFFQTEKHQNSRTVWVERRKILEKLIENISLLSSLVICMETKTFFTAGEKIFFSRKYFSGIMWSWLCRSGHSPSMLQTAKFSETKLRVYPFLMNSEIRRLSACLAV